MFRGFCLRLCRVLVRPMGRFSFVRVKSASVNMCLLGIVRPEGSSSSSSSSEFRVWV